MVGFIDDDKGEWALTHDAIQIPEDTQEFAINMSNYRHWDEPVRQYIDECLAGETGARSKNFNSITLDCFDGMTYTASMRGGVFMCPWDARTEQRSWVNCA